MAFEDVLLRLGVNDAEVRRALDRVVGDVRGMKSTLEGAFSAFGVGEVARKLGEFVKSGADAADKMGKLAQKAGLSTEAMSGLAYAAKLGDIGTDDLGTSLAKLSKTMGDAAQGGKSQQAIFKALGVAWQDATGNLRPVGMVLADIADAFANAEDGPAKAAFAMELFGRSGAALIPWLNGGAQGIRDATDEAERFGFVVSDSAAKAADEFNDNLDRLHMLGQAVAMQIAGELAPSLNALTTTLMDSAAQVGGARSAANGFADSLRILASVAVVTWGVIETGAAHAAAPLAALALAVKGEFAAAGQALLNWRGEVTSQWEGMKAQLDAIWTKGGTGGLQGALKREGGPASGPKRQLRLPVGDDVDKARLKALAEQMKDFNRLVEEAEKVMDAVATPSQKYADTLNDLDRLFGQGAIDQETYAAAVKKAGDDYFKASGGADRLKDSMEAFNRTVDEAERVMDAVASPLEKYQQEMAKLQDLLASGAISQQQFDAAADRAAITLAKSNVVLSGLADGGANAFRSLVEAARNGANAIDALWESMLNSFLSIVDQMISAWIQAQLLMAGGKALAGGGFAGLGETADVGGFMGLESMSLGQTAAAATASTAQAVTASSGSKTLVIAPRLLDGHGFGDWWDRNEDRIVRKMDRLSYLGRIGG